MPVLQEEWQLKGHAQGVLSALLLIRTNPDRNGSCGSYVLTRSKGKVKGKLEYKRIDRRRHLCRHGYSDENRKNEQGMNLLNIANKQIVSGRSSGYFALEFCCELIGAWRHKASCLDEDIPEAAGVTACWAGRKTWILVSFNAHPSVLAVS